MRSARHLLDVSYNNSYYKRSDHMAFTKQETSYQIFRFWVILPITIRPKTNSVHTKVNLIYLLDIFQLPRTLGFVWCSTP